MNPDYQKSNHLYNTYIRLIPPYVFTVTLLELISKISKLTQRNDKSRNEKNGTI